MVWPARTTCNLRSILIKAQKLWLLFTPRWFIECASLTEERVIKSFLFFCPPRRRRSDILRDQNKVDWFAAFLVSSLSHKFVPPSPPGSVMRRVPELWSTFMPIIIVTRIYGPRKSSPPPYFRIIYPFANNWRPTWTWNKKGRRCWQSKAIYSDWLLSGISWPLFKFSLSISHSLWHFKFSSTIVPVCPTISHSASVQC